MTFTPRSSAWAGDPSSVLSSTDFVDLGEISLSETGPDVAAETRNCPSLGGREPGDYARVRKEGLGQRGASSFWYRSGHY